MIWRELIPWVGCLANAPFEAVTKALSFCHLILRSWCQWVPASCKHKQAPVEGRGAAGREGKGRVKKIDLPRVWMSLCPLEAPPSSSSDKGLPPGVWDSWEHSPSQVAGSREKVWWGLAFIHNRETKSNIQRVRSKKVQNHNHNNHNNNNHKYSNLSFIDCNDNTDSLLSLVLRMGRGRGQQERVLGALSPKG